MNPNFIVTTYFLGSWYLFFDIYYLLLTMILFDALSFEYFPVSYYVQMIHSQLNTKLFKR